MQIILYEKKYNKSLKELWKSVFNKSENDSDYLINWLTQFESGILLVAINDSMKVIGSRASWFWNFDSLKFSYRCSQFGLTAVHSNFRRKGVFSMLNKKCIEILISQKVDFIFNISLPNAMLGYEKMGWIYKYNLIRLTRFSFKFLFKKKDIFFEILNELDVNKYYDLINHNLNHNLLTSSFDLIRLENRLKDKKNLKVYQSKGVVILYKVMREFKFRSIIIGEIFIESSEINRLNTHLYNIQFNERSFLISTYLSINNPMYKTYTNLKFKILSKKLPIGIRLLNNNISINHLHENLVLSNFDLDTF